MAINPPTVRYGEATIIATQTVNSTAVHAFVNGQGGSGTTYPNAHLDATSMGLTVTISNGGVGVAAIWAVALVEDGFDPAGDFTNSAQTALIAGVLAYRELNSTLGGTPSNVVLGDGSGPVAALNPVIDKGGTFRLILIQANSIANARRKSNVVTGAGSSDYHQETDRNDAAGSLNVVTSSGQETGACGRRVVLAAQSHLNNLSYGSSPNFSFGIRPSGAASAAIVNPKIIKLAFSLNSDGTGQIGAGSSPNQTKVFRLAPNTTGDVPSPTVPVDTDWPQTNGGTDHYIRFGMNDVFGDATTITSPTDERAHVYTVGTQIGTTTAQRSPYVFSSSGHVAGITFVSTKELRTSTAELKASCYIAPYTTSGKTVLGVASFSSSGRTVAQDIFVRPAPSTTKNSVPFLRTFMVDAYGFLLLGCAFKQDIIRPTDSVSENNQSVSTDGSGKIDWSYSIASTAPAFNRFVKTGVARQTGSVVATGPDSIASPPATFNNSGKVSGDSSGSYPNPLDQAQARGSYDSLYPAYPRNVIITGNQYAGVREPSVQAANVFGISSEVILEGMATCINAQAIIDANQAPSGLVTRTQTLGAGSIRFKASSEVSGTTNRVLGRANGTATSGSTTRLTDTSKNFTSLGVTVGCTIVITGGTGSGQVAIVTSISTTTNPNDTLNFVALGTGLNATSAYAVGEFNPKDIAGRRLDLTDALLGRYAAWNTTAASQHIAPTSMGSNHGLQGALGYGSQSNSPFGFEACPAPSDPASIALLSAYCQDATQRASFDLDSAGIAGFTADAFNFGYFRQNIAFIAADPTLLIQIVPDNLLAVKGSSIRIVSQFSRINPDSTLSPVFADIDPAPPHIYIGMDQGAGLPLLNVVNAVMTSIAPQPDGTSSDWTYTAVGLPDGSYSVIVSGTVNSSRPAAGNAVLKLGLKDDNVFVLITVRNLTDPNRHIILGDQVQASAQLMQRDPTTGLVSAIPIASITSCRFLWSRIGTAGNTEYLTNAADATPLVWVDLLANTPEDPHTPTSDAVNQVFSQTLTVASTWTHDFRVRAIIVYQGNVYVGTESREITGTKFQHGATNESSIPFDAVGGHHHTGADGSRAIGDRS